MLPPRLLRPRHQRLADQRCSAAGLHGARRLALLRLVYGFSVSGWLAGRLAAPAARAEAHECCDAAGARLAMLKPQLIGEGGG